MATTSQYFRLHKVNFGNSFFQFLNLKSCIKTPRMLFDVFENSLVLLQGKVLSLALFSFYVNDVEMEFIKNGNVPLQVEELNLTLMYADDMVCFAESVHELQLMLNTLHGCALK